MLFLLGMLFLTVGYLTVFTLVGAIGYILWQHLVHRQRVSFLEAVGYILEGMLGTNNRRWATLLGMAVTTLIVAASNPGAALLPDVPGNLWGALSGGRQSQVSGWFRHFYGGTTYKGPAAILASQESFFGWFWWWAFWFYLSAWVIYSIPTFSDEIFAFFHWIAEEIRQRRQTQAQARAAQQPGRRGQQAAPAPAPAPPAGGGILQFLGIDLIIESIEGFFRGRRDSEGRRVGAQGMSIAGGLLIALATALVVRLLLPVPVATAFGIIAFVFLLQVIESRFGSGLKTFKQWMAAIGRALAAVVIFLTLRLLAGQLLGSELYPINAWNNWSAAGGVKGIFWGTGLISKLVLWEMLFAFVAGGLMFVWSRGKYRKLVVTIFIIAFLVVAAQVALPRYAATWLKREDIDKALAQKGLIKSLKSATSSPPARVAESVVPLCEGVPLFSFGENETQIRVPIRPGCVVPVSIPTDSIDYKIDSKEGWHERFMWDGNRFLSPANSLVVRPLRIQTSVRTASFWLRGENKDGYATISVTRKSA